MLACALTLTLSACDGSAREATPSPPLSSLGPVSVVPEFDPGRCAAADGLHASLDALESALSSLETAIRNLAGAPNADTVGAALAALSQVKVAGQDLVAALKRSCPTVSPPSSR